MAKQQRFVSTTLLASVMYGLAIAACTTSTSPRDQGSETYIPFANHGGVLDWHVVDDTTLLIQDIHGQWYVAKVIGPAFTLPSTEHLGFVTEPSGTLEKFSAIIVRGQRFPIISLTLTDPPAAKTK
jgi:hypothetical protein